MDGWVEFKDIFLQRLYHVLFTSHLMPGASSSSSFFNQKLCWCFRREQDYDDIDEEDPFNPRARRTCAQNPNLTNMHSFCSYSSSMGSQSSLQPPTQAVTTAPMSDYMWAKGSKAWYVNFKCSLQCLNQVFHSFPGTRRLSLGEPRGTRTCLW